MKINLFGGFLSSLFAQGNALAVQQNQWHKNTIVEQPAQKTLRSIARLCQS